MHKKRMHGRWKRIYSVLKKIGIASVFFLIPFSVSSQQESSPDATLVDQRDYLELKKTAADLEEKGLSTKISGKELTPDNMTNVTAYGNTPESTALFFMASLMRGDETWKSVIPEESADYFQKKIRETYDHVSLLKFYVKGQELFCSNSSELTIYLQYKTEEEVGDEIDKMIIEFRDGRWLVTDIPS